MVCKYVYGFIIGNEFEESRIVRTNLRAPNAIRNNLNNNEIAFKFFAAHYIIPLQIDAIVRAFVHAFTRTLVQVHRPN